MTALHWFFQRPRTKLPTPAPPAPVAVRCRQRLAEAPSVVCGLPKRHGGPHVDARDWAFTFTWQAKR